MSVSLQRYIAECGFASRRRAEELIRQGQVSVNGLPAELGMRVGASDAVKVGRRVLKPEKKIYIIINKPAGYVCSNRPFKGENSIFDLLTFERGGRIAPKEKLFAVGRLDKPSRGLVLLTNDGDLAQRLAHPSYGHEKAYLVEVAHSGPFPPRRLADIAAKFRRGIDIGEGESGTAKKTDYLGDNTFRLVLVGGKKRQIRRMFEAVGLKVADLKRESIGPALALSGLKEGQWRCLSEAELRDIKRR
jgi:23S rRNA pseudouridine2605 synthase